MITFFWGITFAVVKEAIAKVDVFVFLSQRFMLAFIILLPVCVLKYSYFNVKSVIHGSVMGVFLFGGYALQTLALLDTSASNAAFLTGLNVVLVPLLGAIFFGHLINGNMKLGAILSMAGLFFLCTHGSMSFNRGDVFAGLCAVCIALHVIFTGKYAQISDIWWLTLVQLGTVAVLSMVFAGLGKGGIFVYHADILWALILCAIFATVMAFLVQTSMQRFTSPTHTALIFCMEPVFAALYAYLVINEKMGFQGIIGGLLIFSGMVLSEISFPKYFWRKRQIKEELN